MSGSDKQTYYKIGTSPDVPDSAEEFAKTLTAAGCCHGDLALAEAVGSLREFYHLVQAGVPFPTDSIGSFIGYKTDNDPFERATSAGPKTSNFMCKCLQKQLEQYGVKIYDNQEVGLLLTVGSGQSKRIAGVVTIDKKAIRPVKLCHKRFPRREHCACRRWAGRTLQNQRLSKRTGWHPRPRIQGRLARRKSDRIAVRACEHKVPLERLRHVYAGNPAYIQHQRQR